MDRPFALAAMLATLGLAAPAQAQVDPGVQVEVAALLRQNACQLIADDIPGALSAALIDEIAARTAFDDLRRWGFATETPSGTWQLTPAFCGVPQGQPADVLVAALRYHGCTMTEDDAEVFLPAYGLTLDNTDEPVERLLAAGQATLENDRLTLSADLCAGREGFGPLAVAPEPAAPVGDDPAAQEDALIRAVSDAGCRMDNSLAEFVLPSYGLDLEAAEDAAERLVATGRATWEDDAIVLSPSVCAPRPAPADPTAAFVDLVRANGCTLTEADAIRLLPAAGIPFDSVRGIVEQLELAGALMLREGNELLLAPEVCDGSLSLSDLTAPRTAEEELAATGGDIDFFLETTVMVWGCYISPFLLDGEAEAAGIDRAALSRRVQDRYAAGTVTLEGEYLVFHGGSCP